VAQLKVGSPLTRLGGPSASDSEGSPLSTLTKPEKTHRLRRDTLREDQLYWPLQCGIPIYQVGTTVTTPAELRLRMRSMKYARAFVSGVIAVRSSFPGSLGESVSRLRRGWYCLKQYSFSYMNPSLVRHLVKVAIETPGQVLSIYGASYAQLCRHPTKTFISRMGEAWMFPFIGSNPKQSLSTVVNCRKGRILLRHLQETANLVSRGDPNEVRRLLLPLAKAQGAPARAGLRRVTAVRAPVRGSNSILEQAKLAWLEQHGFR